MDLHDGPHGRSRAARRPRPRRRICRHPPGVVCAPSPPRGGAPVRHRGGGPPNRALPWRRGFDRIDRTPFGPRCRARRAADRRRAARGARRPGADGSRAVSAVAVAGTTLPLAWRRAAPLLPPVAVAIALIVQAPLDGFLVGHTATPLVALVIALYSAGRHIEGAAGLAAAALCVVVTTGTRVAPDPAAPTPGAGRADARRRLAPAARRALGPRPGAAAAPVRGASRAARPRSRARRARAAEEERMRIAGDLQAAIAGRLHEITATPTRCRPACGPAITRPRARCWRASPRPPATRSATCAGYSASCAGRRRRRLTPPAAEPPSCRRAQPSRLRRARRRRSRAAAAPRRRRALDRLLAGALFVGAELELAFAAPPATGWSRRHRGADRRAAAVAPPPTAARSRRRSRRASPSRARCSTSTRSRSRHRRGGLRHVRDRRVRDAPARRSPGSRSPSPASAAHAALFYPDGVVAALLGGVAAPWTVGRVIRGHRQLTRRGATRRSGPSTPAHGRRARR